MTNKTGVNDLRELFLRFFESKGHLRLPSFSLIPQNDQSLLLINSGMAPMKPWFKGEEEPPRRRVCTCQKCIRTGDIENIGHTARHGTYFEMLGNFSFGDYFKRDAIHWAWEFLTSPEWVGLDPDRLYPSVFEGNETTPADEEAFRIWNEEIGIPAERIFKFGKEDNFWEHGSGPCGPCSEIYYDEGTAVFGMSRHSVDYPVRTHLLRIIVFHYDAGLDAGAYDDSLSIEIFERKMLQCVKHRRNDC